MKREKNKYGAVLIYIILAALSFGVFWQVHDFDFSTYDDEVYVKENRYVKAGLTYEGVIWAFSSSHTGNWHPLTWLSHMVDCELFGLVAGRHHLTNLFFHIANTLLLFGILKRMTGAIWRSGFVAALFALHPLHVESVAWISERKDVLSSFFFLLTVAGYVGYVERGGAGRYILIVLLFALGLMSKSMVVTMPFLLLLLDYWPLGRFGKNKKVIYRLILEKVPMFMLSAVLSVVTFVAQRGVDTVVRIDLIPLKLRISNTFVSYVKYIGKMFWPGKLAVLYPHPGKEQPIWQVLTAALFLLVISLLVIGLARKYKYLLVGWLWYLGTLVPVIGLVQVGIQAMADRYSYIPLTGLFIMVSWGVSDALTKWRYRKIIFSISAFTVLFALAVCSSLQVRHWRNGVTLFGHNLDVTGDSSMIHEMLGGALQSEGRLEEASRYLNRALEINPNYVRAHISLGSVLHLQGKFEEAISCYRNAIELEGDNVKAHNNLGAVYQSQGKLNEAAGQYSFVLQLEPDHANAHYNLAKIFKLRGKIEGAISHYQHVLKVKPDDAEVHNELGLALQSQGRFSEAQGHFQLAIEAGPDLAEAHNNIGVIFASQGKSNEAISHFRRALESEPNNPEIHYNLGLSLSSKGKLDEAIAYYEQALQFKSDYVKVHNKLARAYIAQGKFDEALGHYNEILQIQSDNTDSMSNLAMILVSHPDPSKRDTAKAIRYAERAAEQTGYKDAIILNTLAVVYAASGRIEEALATAESALELALTAKDDVLAGHIRRQLELYRHKKP